MIFKIKFDVDPVFTEKRNYGVLQTLKCEFGTDNIKEINKLYNTNNIDASMIHDNTVHMLSWTYDVCITEKQAMECSHFKNTTKVTVYVPPNFLDKYQSIKYEISCKQNILGKIISVLSKKFANHIYVYNFIDSDKIFEDWKKAGFLLNWH